MQNILLVIAIIVLSQFNSFGQYYIINASGESIQVRVWEGNKLIYSHTMPTGQILNASFNEPLIIQYSYPRPYMLPSRNGDVKVNNLGPNWWQFDIPLNKRENWGVGILPPFIERV